MSLTGGGAWKIATIMALIVVFVPVGADSQVTYKAGDVQQGGTTDRCCFNNFRFAGTCEVRIGQNQRCNDILSSLNNFNSVGTFCGNTTVRGGWTTVKCAAGSATFEIDSTKDTVSSGSAIEAPRARSPENTQIYGTTSTRGTSGQNFVTPVPETEAKAQDASLLSL